MRKTLLYVILFGVMVPALIASAQSVGSSMQLSVTVVYPPTVPTGLTASTTSSSAINLSWTETGTNQDGFFIEEAVGNDSVFTPIDTVGPNVRTYSRTGLLPSTTYFYRVSAFNDAGGSTFSNEASAVTSAAPTGGGINGGGGRGGGGGGGGGGGPSYVPPVYQTSADFRGIAYPSSLVTLLENGQVVATTESGPDAKFEVDLSNIAPGSYNFGVWAKDPQGNQSITQTFSVTLTDGAATIVSGIFFPPTISADKLQVKRGDVLTLLGYSAPVATITVVVNSVNEVTQQVTSTDAGAWTYQLNTDALEYGSHTAHAWAATDGSVTPDSDMVAFTVGNSNVTAPTPTACPSKGDLNSDCRVNLVDFSILAYWYGKPNPPAGYLFDGKSAVDFTDFSILAYYWTG